MCRLITLNVKIWNHDLVEVLYTHVSANNEHCTSMKQVYHMSNHIFSPREDELSSRDIQLCTRCTWKLRETG